MSPAAKSTSSCHLLKRTCFQVASLAVEEKSNNQAETNVLGTPTSNRQPNPRTNAIASFSSVPTNSDRHPTDCPFLQKNDPRRAVLAVRAPTTCSLAPPSLCAFVYPSSDTVRNTTTTQRLLALNACSDSSRLIRSRASSSASAVSHRATLLLGGGCSSSSSASEGRAWLILGFKPVL